MREAVAPLAAVRGADRCRTVAPLLETDIAVRGAVVACIDLKLNPSGRQVCAVLDSAFEAFREADEGGLVVPSLVDLRGWSKFAPAVLPFQ